MSEELAARVNRAVIKARQAAQTELTRLCQEQGTGQGGLVYLAVQISPSSKMRKQLVSNGFRERDIHSVVMKNPQGLWYGSQAQVEQAAERARQVLRESLGVMAVVEAPGGSGV